MKLLRSKGRQNESRGKIGILVGLAGISINALIFSLELYSGIVTKSTTLIADAFNNLVDSVSAVVTVMSFLLAGKPADCKHPFGFGRVEYLGSFFIGIIVLGISAFFAKTSFEKILHPSPVRFNAVAVALMLGSVILKLLYGLLDQKYAQKIASQTLAATFIDTISDVFVLIVATFSLLFVKWTGIPVDGPLGLLVSCFIFFSGVLIIKRAGGSLIGKAPDLAIVKSIFNAVSHAKYVAGVHDLIVHDYGPGKTIASIHAEIPSQVSLPKANESVEQAERVLRKQGVELIVHIDPVKTDGKGQKLKY